MDDCAFGLSERFPADRILPQGSALAFLVCLLGFGVLNWTKGISFLLAKNWEYGGGFIPGNKGCLAFPRLTR